MKYEEHHRCVSPQPIKFFLGDVLVEGVISDYVIEQCFGDNKIMVKLEILPMKTTVFEDSPMRPIYPEQNLLDSPGKFIDKKV